MNDWLIIPEEKLPDLEAINANYTDRKCTAMPDENGVLLTRADKLADPYWSSFHVFLSSLAPFQGAPVWPITEEHDA
jgi:hypothetical protein